jgi:hypothetical protein
MAGNFFESDLDLVRRAAKEIVCCLLPDELPYFDVIWQAMGPMLADPAFRSADDTAFLGRLEDRLGGLAFATNWSKDADLLTVPLIMVLRDSLECAIAGGICSDDEVGQIVAEKGLRQPVPEKFLRMVQMFVAMICGAMAEPKTEIEKLISHAKSLLPHKSCYYVFHDGEYRYYPDRLPEQVMNLRGTALFWINPDDDEFLCCKERRTKDECPKDTSQKMLRFLCMKNNADKIISFEELHKYVWKPSDWKDAKSIRNYVNVIQNQLNNFADHQFITSDKSKIGSAPVFRMWGEDKYQTSPNTPKECCIIARFALAE